jgi:tRNA 2-thiocytidine biosynthesis protein TtcA
VRSASGAQPPARSATLRRLEARLRGLAGKAIEQYRMIEAGDRVMVCVSGGKDSFTLLTLLRSLQRSAPVSFELIAVNLDQKQPGFPAQVLPRYFESIGVPYHIIEQDTYRVVKRLIPEGDTMCSLCSRLRRGALYRFASEHGVTKIALGHHRDDIVETLFLNLFHGGRLKAMAPKLRSQDGRHIIIRPLAFIAERDIERYARGMRFPIIPCRLCGSQPNLQRNAIKAMLAVWEREQPGRIESIFSALRQVEPATLADQTLFDFASLRASVPSAASIGPAEPAEDGLADVDGEAVAPDAAAALTALAGSR